MPALIYVGDSTSHGGMVLTGSPHITLNGRAAARKGDRVSCPLCGDNLIAEGNPSICDAGQPMAFHGHKTACGATLIASSNSTETR